MIKKIETKSVTVGMYIHAFGEGSHHLKFKMPPFLLDSHPTRMRLQSSDIEFVLIDTDKGLDGGNEILETPGINPSAKLHISKNKQTTVQEELPAAKNIVNQANVIMKSVMSNVRMGKPLDVHALEPLTEKIMDSVMRNNNALISLSRIKNKDDYTFMHSVSVSGLMIAFAKANGLDENAIHEIALGGLLHDIGKMITPNEILNKPGKLTDDEFVIMKNHVIEAENILENKLHLSNNTLDVIFQHHEKMDGSGYPHKLTDSQLSEVGKMSSIVDIYDALTSIRVYKPAWEPAFTLKKMMEWTDGHLDKTQLFKFINFLGVYPVGSLIEMESGRVGIVIDQHPSDILKPQVKFFYAKHKGYTNIEIKDLSLEKNDRILTPITPAKYEIDLRSYI